MSAAFSPSSSTIAVLVRFPGKPSIGPGSAPPSKRRRCTVIPSAPSGIAFRPQGTGGAGGSVVGADVASAVGVGSAAVVGSDTGAGSATGVASDTGAGSDTGSTIGSGLVTTVGCTMSCAVSGAMKHRSSRSIIASASAGAGRPSGIRSQVLAVSLQIMLMAQAGSSGVACKTPSPFANRV